MDAGKREGQGRLGKHFRLCIVRGAPSRGPTRKPMRKLSAVASSRCYFKSRTGLKEGMFRNGNDQGWSSLITIRACDATQCASYGDDPTLRPGSGTNHSAQTVHDSKAGLLKFVYCTSDPLAFGLLGQIRERSDSLSTSDRVRDRPRFMVRYYAFRLPNNCTSGSCGIMVPIRHQKATIVSMGFNVFWSLVLSQ